MTVGIGRLAMFLPECRSLKDKRTILRRVKDRTRQKFNVAVAEVGDNDLWQRAVLGLALVGNDRRFVESALDDVIGFVRAEVELAGRAAGQVVGVDREVQTFSDGLAEPDFAFKAGTGR